MAMPISLKSRLKKIGWGALIILMGLAVVFIVINMSSGNIFQKLFNSQNYNSCGPWWGDLFN